MYIGNIVHACVLLICFRLMAHKNSDSVHRLEASSHNEKAGLVIMKKKDTSGSDERRSFSTHDDLASSSSSVLGLDRLAALKRADYSDERTKKTLLMPPPSRSPSFPVNDEKKPHNSRKGR